MRARILAAALVLVVAGTMHGFTQGRLSVVGADDVILDLLGAVAAETGLEPRLSSPPYTTTELLELVARIDDSRLSEAGRRALDLARTRLSSLVVNDAGGLSVGIHPQASLEGYLAAPTTGEGLAPERGYQERLPLVSLPLEVWIGSTVYAFADLALRQNHDATNAALVPSDPFNWTLDADVLDTEVPQRAFVAAGGPHWAVTIGRDRFGLGNGESGNLLLSDAADFQDFARLSAYWDAFEYSAFWIQLYSNHDRYRAPFLQAQALGVDQQYYPRNLFLHRFEFSPWQRASLAVTEGILVGGIPPDLVYFNPLIVFHDLYRWGHASSIISLEATVNPWKYFQVYGQAAFNQIQTPYELIRYGTGAADTPNASAYLGGIRAEVPAWMGYIDAGVEGAFVGPWMYIRENDLISYEWWRWTNSNVAGSQQWVSAPLGYFTGPDALAFSAWLGYSAAGMFDVRLDLRRVAKGEQEFSTPYAEDAAAIALMTPTGIPEYRTVVHLSASGDPLPWLRLGADLYWISVDNLGHSAGVSATDLQANASVTVHWDF